MQLSRQSRDSATTEASRAPSSERTEFARIIVIATQQLGDVLLTTPLIRAVRERWPAGRIDVLGFTGTLGMLSGNPDIDGTIEVRRGGGWKRILETIKMLWRRYDLALVTRGGDRAHLYAWLAAPTRSGIVPLDSSSRWWKRLALDHVVDESADAHQVLEKLRLLQPWVEPGERPRYVVPPGQRALPADVLGSLSTAPVVVHVPSRWRYKQWPVQHFVALVGGLLSDGRQVVLTGGPDAADRALVSQVAACGTTPQLLDLCGRLDFGQLTTLLKQAALYIGPDASITHLAAACGTPMIALFGPTPPTAWGSWPQGASGPPYKRRGARQVRPPIVLLQGPGDCVPCARAGCENHKNSRSDCLQALSPQQVLAEARTLLAARCDALPVSD